MQIYVKNLIGSTDVYDITATTTLSLLRESIYKRCSYPPLAPIHLVTSSGKRLCEDQSLYASYKKCKEDVYLPSHSGADDVSTPLTALGITHESVLCVTLLLRGGKGGFGTALRAKAKKKGKHELTDFGACRDLSGRRLRHVNDEQILQKWSRSQEKGEVYDPLKGSVGGLENWFLATPSWIQVHKKSSYSLALRTKTKTQLCKDWVSSRAARPSGNAPAGAPQWWGCPRGSRCMFAHGEGDLKGLSKHALDARKAQELEKILQLEQNRYTDGLTSAYYEDEAVNDMVQQGLARSRKRLRAEPAESQAPEQADFAAAPTTADSKSGNVLFPLQCVNGAVDVTVSSATMAALEAGDLHRSRAVYRLEGLSSFGTVVCTEGVQPSVGDASCALGVPSQSWSYEVVLKSSGLMQIGWIHSLFLVSGTSASAGQGSSQTPSSGKGVGDGVGDDPYSWGWDGSRGLAWHGQGEPVSFPASSVFSLDDKARERRSWVEGDVVRCTLTLHRATGRAAISYAVNGHSIGTAFLDIDLYQLQQQYAARSHVGEELAAAAFFPAMSLEEEEVLEVHLFVDEEPAVSSSYSVAHLYEELPLPQVSAAGAVSGSGADLSVGSLPAVEVAVPIPLLEAVCAADLESWGLVMLKEELARRGLKTGGTLAERAQRLFSVRDVNADAVDDRHKARSRTTGASKSAI